jgi:hypothetical protein
MKYTQYFQFTRNRSDRQDIKEEWIINAFQNPIHEELQSDGRVRRWAWVEEEQKYLRIIILNDKETIHNAFFDRNFKK